MVIGSKQMLNKIQDTEINIEIDGRKIKQVFECTILGVNVDQHLSWKNKTERLCEKITSGIDAFKTLTEYVGQDSLLSVYNAIVQPYFNYGCEVWNVLGKLNLLVYKNYITEQPEL